MRQRPRCRLVADGAALTAHAVDASSPAASRPAVLTAAYVTRQVDSTLSSTVRVSVTARVCYLLPGDTEPVGDEAALGDKPQPPMAASSSHPS